MGYRKSKDDSLLLFRANEMREKHSFKSRELMLQFVAYKYYTYEF